MQINGVVLQIGSGPVNLGGYLQGFVKALEQSDPAKSWTIPGTNITLPGLSVPDSGPLKSLLDSITKLLGKTLPAPQLVPVGGAKVVVEIDLYDEKGVLGVLHHPKITATTSSNGAFSVNVPSNYNDSKAHVYVVMEKRVPVSLSGVPDLVISYPLYRSDSFAVADRTVSLPVAYQVHMAGDNEHIGQAKIQPQLDAAKAKGKLISISAAVKSNTSLGVKAEKSGGTITFDVNLAPRTGADLSRFIDAEVGNEDIDLPGPDFITGICADKSAIRTQVVNAVATMEKGLKQSIAETFTTSISQSIPGIGSLVQPILQDLVSLSIYDIRAPQVATPVPLPTFIPKSYELAIDSVVSFPRSIG